MSCSYAGNSTIDIRGIQMTFSRSKLASSLLAFTMAAFVSPALQAAEPVTVISGGDILTMEGVSPRYAEAVVVKDGVIRFVGAKSEALKVAGAKARQFNLGGKTLCPASLMHICILFKPRPCWRHSSSPPSTGNSLGAMQRLFAEALNSWPSSRLQRLLLQTARPWSFGVI